MLHVSTGFLEHGLDIAAALLCLLLDRRGNDLALSRIDGNLARAVEHAVCSMAWLYGPTAAGA